MSRTLSRLRNASDKCSYYVWFLGAREARGLRGRESVEDVANELLHQEKQVEPSKVTLHVNKKGIKILQNIGKRFEKGRYEAVKHRIPDHAISFACQHSIDLDVVSCILLIFNPVTRCPVHVHVYRCDSPETASDLSARLLAMARQPENIRHVKQLEQRLLSRGLLPGGIQSGPSTLPPPAASTPVQLTSALVEELRRKISSRDNSGRSSRSPSQESSGIGSEETILHPVINQINSSPLNDETSRQNPMNRNDMTEKFTNIRDWHPGITADINDNNGPTFRPKSSLNDHRPSISGSYERESLLHHNDQQSNQTPLHDDWHSKNEVLYYKSFHANPNFSHELTGSEEGRWRVPLKSSRDNLVNEYDHFNYNCPSEENNCSSIHNKQSLKLHRYYNQKASPDGPVCFDLNRKQDVFEKVNTWIRSTSSNSNNWSSTSERKNRRSSSASRLSQANRPLSNEYLLPRQTQTRIASRRYNQYHHYVPRLRNNSHSGYLDVNTNEGRVPGLDMSRRSTESEEPSRSRSRVSGYNEINENSTSFKYPEHGSTGNIRIPTSKNKQRNYLVRSNSHASELYRNDGSSLNYSPARQHFDHEDTCNFSISEEHNSIPIILRGCKTKKNHYVCEMRPEHSIINNVVLKRNARENECRLKQAPKDEWCELSFSAKCPSGSRWSRQYRTPLHGQLQ